MALSIQRGVYERGKAFYRADARLARIPAVEKEFPPLAETEDCSKERESRFY